MSVSTGAPVGDEVLIRPWRVGDERLLAGIGDALSAASLRSRFCAGTPRLPAGYLRHIASAPREQWDAQVAQAGDGRIVGWAEFARPTSPAEADLAIVVLDGWQRRGVGGALVRAMLSRILALGVKVVHADVELGNDPVRRLIDGVVRGTALRERLSERRQAGDCPPPEMTVEFIGGLLHYEFRVESAAG